MRKKKFICTQIAILIALLFCVAAASTAQDEAARLRSKIRELEEEGLRRFGLENDSRSTAERLELRIEREAQYKKAAGYLESYLELFRPVSREYAELLFRLGVLHYFAGDESEAVDVFARCKAHLEVREGRANYEGKQIRGLLEPLSEEDVSRFRRANEEIRTIKKEFDMQRVIGSRPPG